MTIQSAKFANADNDAVIASTDTNGAVLIQLYGEDISGGWREIYIAWSIGNTTTEHSDPTVM